MQNIDEMGYQSEFCDLLEGLGYFHENIDYDAIARDLAIDYTETTVAEQKLIYRAS